MLDKSTPNIQDHHEFAEKAKAILSQVVVQGAKKTSSSQPKTHIFENSLELHVEGDAKVIFNRQTLDVSFNGCISFDTSLDLSTSVLEIDDAALDIEYSYQSDGSNYDAFVNFLDTALLHGLLTGLDSPYSELDTSKTNYMSVHNMEKIKFKKSYTLTDKKCFGNDILKMII